MATPQDQTSLADQAAFARQVLSTEAEAVSRIVIDGAFHRAVDLVLAATSPPQYGSVVVTGVGKSGLIGAKLSATFASTGTPSHFLHPTEAMHGDLGRIRRGDVVLALSFGGTTEEIISLASILRQDAVPVVAIVGKPECELAQLATVTLAVGDLTEACPMNLAPTASTTAMLALGDALALCVSRRREFGVEDFRRIHPGGALGRQLMSVTEAMRFKIGVNVPAITPETTIREAYAQATAMQSVPGVRTAGALLVVDGAGLLAGIFTDGDLRRLVLKQSAPGAGPVGEVPIGQAMTRNPRRLTDTALVRDAVQIVREFRIDEVPVVDSTGRPVGLIDVQDLVALKVIEG